MRYWVQIAVALIGMVGLVAPAYLQLKSVADNAPGPLTEGQKLCRATRPNTFTDGLIVGKTWTSDNCAAYASKIGATEYALGCVWPNEVQFGQLVPLGSSESAQPPRGKSCGW